MAPKKPETWTAKHAIRCPYCGKLFEASWRSDRSQRDADEKAEETVWEILNAHILRTHPRGI